MSVFNDEIREDTLSLIDIDDNETQNSVKKGDIFFTISSETANEVGMCSTINFDKDNVYLNSFCFGYRLNNKDIDSNYLCYLLKTKNMRKKIINLGQGFTRVNLSKKQLLDLTIDIPSLEEQMKISNILKLEEIIIQLENNKLTKLQELKKGLMQSMFV